MLLRYFAGLPPRTIAERLDVPVATLWNRLRRALAGLRKRLDGEHGGQRRAWAMKLKTTAAIAASIVLGRYGGVVARRRT